MKHTRKVAAAIAIACAASLSLAGCGSTPGGESSDSGSVTLTWWHNATSDPLKGLWEQVAKEFEDAHPGVTINVTGYQNEELQRTLIPQALLAGGDSVPDVFMVWPGGEVASQVQAGYLKDLTTPLADVFTNVGLKADPWKVDGKSYAVPYTFGAEGLWYNKDLYAQAGITTNPKTLPELEAANEKVRALGVAPIAVGGATTWAAAHWWYQFAIASCSTSTLEKSIANLEFTDPCWVAAGKNLQDFIATNPFQDGWLATSAQEGAGSSAGLVGNGKAAMELMGHWDAGTIGSVSPGEKVPDFLSWMPMVSIPGAAGTPGIMMGGGDGWGVYKDAPDEAVELVKYLMSDDVQKRFAATGAGIPTNPNGISGLEDPSMKLIAQATDDAPYIQLWLDSALGPAFGEPLNQAVVNLMAGQGTPEDVVKALTDTAAKQ